MEDAGAEVEGGWGGGADPGLGGTRGMGRADWSGANLGPTGYGRGFGGSEESPEWGPTRAQREFQRDLARYGLTLDDLANWATSYPNPAVELSRATLDSLSWGQRLAEFARNVGRNSWGLPGLLGAIDTKAADLALQAAAPMFGVGAPIVGRVARGLGSISTGRMADHGGGFTGAGTVDRGGRTVDVTLGEPTAQDLYYQWAMQQGVVPAPTPGQIGGAGPTVYPPQGGLPLDVYAAAPGSPEAYQGRGLPMAAPAAQGLPVAPTVPAMAAPPVQAMATGGQVPPLQAAASQLAQSGPGSGAEMYRLGAGGLDPASLRQQAYAQLLQGERTPNRALQMLAVGIAGAGDLARNLMTDPQTGRPIYAPSAANMNTILSQQARTEGEGGGRTSRAKTILDATQQDREYQRQVANDARTATKDTVETAGKFLERVKTMQEQAADMTPEQRETTTQALRQMRASLGLPAFYDDLVSFDRKTVDFASMVGALGPWLEGKDAQAQMEYLGITTSAFRRDPEKATGQVKALLGAAASTEILQRTRAAAGYLRQSGRYGDGPIPLDDVKDLVVGQAGPKAEAFRQAYEGTLFGKEATDQFNTALGALGVDPIGAKQRRAERAEGTRTAIDQAVQMEEATRPGKLATAVQTEEALRPGKVAAAVETEEATRAGKVKTAEAMEQVKAKFKTADPAKYSDVADLRKDFEKASGSFITVRDAYARLRAIEPSPAGDIALIYGFMKMQDPGSTVREGEYATAENAGGVTAKVRQLWNKMVDGDKLTPEMRADFRKQVDQQFDVARRQQNQREQEWTRLAKSHGFDPGQVVVDVLGDLRGPAIDRNAIDAELRRRKGGRSAK